MAKKYPRKVTISSPRWLKKRCDGSKYAISINGSYVATTKTKQGAKNKQKYLRSLNENYL